MSYIYIVGDSYCFYRTDADTHWPAILAKKLNLELQGQGFPGQGWWPVRQHLIDYCNTDNFDRTKYFIFCHTQPQRLLSSNPIFGILSSEAEQARKIWHAYIQTNDVSEWCMQQWFYELNKLVQGKQVLHIQCFHINQEYISTLGGLKFAQPLLDLAIESAGGTKNSWETDNAVNQRMNQYHNHLSPDYNMMLADQIYKQITAEFIDQR